MVDKPNNTLNDFSATHNHLEDLNHRFVGLLGGNYAINLDKPEDFNLEGETFIRYPNRCIYYTHNNKHYDENPSGWIAVSQKDSRLISGCWACKRPQVIKRPDGYQPAPTLLTLSCNDKRLLKVLVAFGCKEVTEVNEYKQPAVAFPVTYADGSEGFHYRVALEGKDKWRHKEGGKAGEAVFALHKQGIQKGIQKKRMVVVTESPVDAAVLNGAGFPAIAVLGKGNAGALACDLHKQTLLNLLGDDGVIFVWVEPDAAKFAQEVANALQRPVKVIYPPVPEEDPKALKDAFRLWLACGKGWDRFKAEIDRLIANATEVTPQPEPVIEPKIVRVRNPFEEAVWRPLSEITMPRDYGWQVEGLIYQGNLVILSARPKTSKSIVALNLAACVAMGKPFLDRSVAQGRALFVAYERYKATLKRALAMGLASCEDFMLWDKVAYKLPKVDMLDGWLDFIERNGVKLVVFDTLVHFLRPELEKVRNGINAYDHIYKVMETLQTAAEETGCTIVLIHHDRKGETAETDEARVLGTTALTASPDAVFQLKAMSDKVICLKASGNEIEETTLYFKVSENFWIELTDKPVMTKEEEAARVIEDYLRQHGEATRQDLIRLLVEKGLAKASSAPVLLQRAIDDYLRYRLEKRVEGRQAIYRLMCESRRPSLPPAQPETEPADSPQETRPVTHIENVTVVIRQPDQPEPTSNMCNTSNTNNNEYHVTGVTGQPEPEPDRRITTITPSIGVTGLSNDPQEAPTEPAGSPEGDLQGDPLWVENEEELWGWFTPERLKPSARADQRESPEPTENLTEPDLPESSPTLPCAQAQSEVSPPDLPAGSPTEPDRPEGNPPANGIEFIRINSISTRPEPDPLATISDDIPPDRPDLQGNPPAKEPNPATNKRVEGNCVVVATEDWVEDDCVVVVSSDDNPPKTPKDSGLAGGQSGFAPPELPVVEPEPEAGLAEVETPLLSPDLPTNEPEGNPPEQPVATLTEPVCPVCGERLEPEPESGLAACLGCGRLFKVEIPPVSPDDDNDNPPDPHNNGNGGSQSGVAPPENEFIQINSIPTQHGNRMTELLPDGSVKLAWQGKTETVAPDDLAGWQPIEDIPEVDLPDIESVEIPPVVVLDLETNGLDPKRGRILAVGLALFVEGDAKEMTIIYNNEVNDDGEANLLLQVFDWLRETYDRFGEFILTGYNMFDFDLTYIIERSRRLGLKHDCPFDYEKYKNGKIKRLSIPDTNGKYTYTAIKTDLSIMLIDTQHLVIRWDEFEKVLLDYRLKTAAKQFGVNIPDRPELTPEEIVQAFFNDRPKFNAYLFADLRETYAVFERLIKQHAALAALAKLNLEDIARKHGSGWVWQQHYERHYSQIPQKDEWREYEGGLVVCRKGLWFNCAKFDIASLYPTIMLAYRIHSRKDPDQIGLRYLKTYTMKRLELKWVARETGDETADNLQNAMKVLINSKYGYLASRYPFNDIDAAERVTTIGRKVLICMIAAVEDLGLLVVEADTDGIIVACQDKDPQEVWQAIRDAIPPVFKVELEWQGKVVFVSEKKNYIVFEPNGDPFEVKGGKWCGRDKPAYATEAIPKFVRLWFMKGKEAALEYARWVLSEIESGNGWDWVVCTRRVGKNDKALQAKGFKAGEKATFAYKRKTNKPETTEIALKPEEGYDCKYYAKEFSDLIEEVIEAIDPAQIEAWREIVNQEARPLIFATT